MSPSRVLPIIVIAQFCCTSLWFAGNAIMGDLIHSFSLPESALRSLTSSVQFGFISGTLVFALLSIADRFSPSKVFFFSALVGSTMNILTVWEGNSMESFMVIRFLTGFFLAGIYPVGMKIAADYFDKGLGKSLGYLVGALVLGTAFPHFLKAFTGTLPWSFVVYATSSLALIGGILILILVPDGPFRKSVQKVTPTVFFTIFRNKKFRRSAFGYFGHMWELYTFWAFVPFILEAYNNQTNSSLDVSLYSFIIIASGSIACVLAGYLSIKYGTKKIARLALLTSGVCCLLSPLIGLFNNEIWLVFIMIIWGMAVIPDSPLFSTMVAQSAPKESTATALTIVNCIGFAITILSIQLISFLSERMDSNLIFLVLAVGPLFGLIFTRKIAN